jgi:hypothetical protein
MAAISNNENKRNGEMAIGISGGVIKSAAKRKWRQRGMALPRWRVETRCGSIGGMLRHVSE